MSPDAGSASQFVAVLPYVVALLALVTMALIFLGVRHALEAKTSGGGGGGFADSPLEGAASEQLPSPTLLESIKLASVQLRRLVAGGAGVYEVPWVVVVGAGGPDLDRLLPEALPWPSDLAGAHRDVLGRVGRISFCRTGAVLGFDDGLLDGPQWRQRWNSLVRALQTCRPERPIDGLVVVISASELRETAERQDRLAALGDQIYHLIWSVQRMTGWRIPVHLLVSGCDQLTGFADWVLALPPQTRQQILGWSVPYAVDSVFEPSWVDEGIAEVGGQLSIAQLLLMMPEPEVGVAEGLLLFPGEVQRLAAALSVLLTRMLRTSAYHEAFMFRGFFLAGRLPGAAVAGSQSDAFAEALFTEKVFPEHKLAQPAYGEATRKHRQIRIAQVVLAVVAVLCVFGIVHIRQVQSVYFPPVQALLGRIDRQVTARALRTEPKDSPQAASADRPRVRDTALSLLNAMADIEINRIDTIAAPTSLLTSVNTRVEQAIAAGYNTAVLHAAYEALTDKSSLVANLEPVPPPGAMVPTSSQALATTVKKIVEYDKYIQVYQGISARPSISDVATLMNYALDVQLPPGFTTNYGLYEHALSSARMPPIRTTDVQLATEKILRERYDAAVKDAYADNQLATSVTQLAALGITPAAARGQPSLGSGRKVLVEAQTTLDRITGLLSLPGYDWLGGKPDPASPVLTLDRLNGVQVVPADFIDDLRASGAKTEAETRDKLLHATAFGGALVLNSANGAVTLSPPMAASRGLLDDLFSQPFMQPVPTARAAMTSASGTRINWDSLVLRQAEDLAESYVAFAPKDDGTIPQSIQRQVQSVAAAEATANISLLLRLAARPTTDLPNGGSRAMLEEVSGFATVLPMLVNLRNTLRQAGAVASAGALDAQVSEQAVRLLREVDQDLVSAAPYQLADPGLSFWHGSPPLAEPAFGADSPTDLASTLPPRRDFVETLARKYAAPLVSYLSDPGTSGNAAAAGLVARWQSTVDTLDRYHRSDPSNSLTRLEQFITVDMDKIDLSNCRQLVAGGGKGGNYFAEQLQGIRRAIASRCGTAVNASTAGRYTSLSTAFNGQLAGRFPFAPVTSPGPGATGPIVGAADPNDVRRFLIEYGPDLPTLQAQFQSGAYGDAGRAAEVFLRQLLAVQNAFGPMLADPSGNTPLSYQVDIEFFTNPAAAKGQNQVIDAAVSAGNQRASSMNGTSRISWTNGQPLHVDLRWAANAPMVPDGSVRYPSLRINSLNAGFDFSDSWALLRLIRAQAPGSADLNALQDRRPEVVAFDVPLKRNSNAATGGDADVDTARVYMRFALTGVLHAPGQPDKSVPLALPEFPTTAPLLGGTMSYTGRPSSPAPSPVAVPNVRSALQ